MYYVLYFVKKKLVKVRWFCHEGRLRPTPDLGSLCIYVMTNYMRINCLFNIQRETFAYLFVCLFFYLTGYQLEWFTDGGSDGSVLK